MSSGNEWKKELYKASRTTLLTISNETDFILQRVSVKLQQGVLRVFPPEIIAPSSKVEFASESNALITGTKGSVIYLVLPAAVAPIPTNNIQSLSHLVGLKLWEPFVYVTIEWSNPYWSSHSCSISSQQPMETKYYLSHEEINRQIHSEAKTHIRGRPTFKLNQKQVALLCSVSPSNNNKEGGTTGGNTSPKHSRSGSNGGNTPTSPNIPRNGSGNLGQSLSPSNLSSSNSPTMTSSGNSTTNRNSGVYPLSSTLSFLSSLSSSPLRGTSGAESGGFPFPWSSGGGASESKDSWKHAVRRATRGQFVTVVNKTSRLLIRRDYVLEHGSWCELPPEGIAPGTTIEFGTASGLCAGTDGSVYYYSSGLKGDIKLQFNNPFIGENTFSSHCPPQFVVERQISPGTISSVTFTIIDKSSLSSSTSSTTANNSSNSLTPSSISTLQIKDDFVRLISLNVGLMAVNSPLSQEDRAQAIANNIVNMPEKYDIVCLQGVFSASARDRLSRIMRNNYTYIIEKSGEDSGLYFASTFPILWSDFRLFNEGIGLDVHSSKGVQGVKLDISSIRDNSVLYVFNAHLQSNPVEGSVAWQMVSGDDKLKKAQTVRTLQLQSIRDFISTELSIQNHSQHPSHHPHGHVQGHRHSTSNLSTSLGSSLSSLSSSSSSTSSLATNTSSSTPSGPTKKSVALILCGDMNIVAENEQVVSDEGSIILSQIIPEVARKINSREITSTFSHQLMAHIAANNIPMRFLGILRAQVTNPRMKSLILTEMVTYIIKKEIVELLSQRHNQQQQLKQQKQQSGGGGGAEDDESNYKNIVLEMLNRVLHYDTKQSTDYWNIQLKRRLRTEFVSGLTELEEMEFVDLRAHVINLQLVTSLKTSLELTLQSKSIYQLVKGSRFNSNIPPPLITSDNIEELILPPLTSYWGIENNTDICYISSNSDGGSGGGSTSPMGKAESDENNRIKILLKPTEEYESLQNILGNPVDMFRMANPRQPGYTIHQSLNQMVQRAAAKERIDYIFSFNLSPNFGDDDGRNQLLRLNCIESSILPFGSTPQTRLSDHFAVECIINLKVDDQQQQSNNH